MLLPQPLAFAAQLQACAVHQQVHGLRGVTRIGTGPLRPRHLQRRSPSAEGRMVRHTQAEAEQADDGAEQAFSLPVGQAEHRTYRERRQDRQRRIPKLPTAGRPWFGRPRRVRLIRESHRQAAALAQAGVVGRPVRDLVPLPRNVMTAVLVQLERQGGHPGQDKGTISYPAQLLSTNHPIRAPRFRNGAGKRTLPKWSDRRPYLAAPICTFSTVIDKNSL